MNTTSNSICSSADMEPPRKKRFRAKLDHMTPEEKQERRKEKNRQAAQTARDRKRKNMDRLAEENQRLREENMRLRSQLLGNGQMLAPPQSQDASMPSPAHQINDSGVSDIGSPSVSNSTSYLADNIKLELQNGTSATRVMTPDSNCYTNTLSPTHSEIRYIDECVERDNELALVNYIQDLVKDVENDAIDESPLETAELIRVPPLKVRTQSIASAPTTNSLGWTSIQLMLILMVSRIHHRLSGRTNCCRKQLLTSTGGEEMDPVNDNLYDYILQTRCINFRRAYEAIISNRNNIRQQRLIALNFVHKYLYNVNLNWQRQHQQQLQQQQLQQQPHQQQPLPVQQHRQLQPGSSIMIRNASGLVKVQQ